MIVLLEALGCVSSTNDVLRERAAEGAPHGLAVWASEQTHGRGRLGRSWHSPAGASLYFSLLVRIRPGQGVELLPLAAGLAAAETVESLSGAPVRLKWPNDLLLGDRKLGGVLCEGVLTDGRVVAAVVGIGINVSLQTSDLPDSIAEIATSLAIAGYPPPPLESLAGALRVQALRRCEQVLDGDVGPVLDAWRERDATIGRLVRLDADGRIGTACGIHNNGFLRVRFPDGEQSVSSGEVHVLKPTELPHAAGH